MASSGCLSVTDLRDVLEELHDARTKWYNFGLQVELKCCDLDAIKQRNKDDPDECFADLLRSWLKQAYPKPTWKAVVDALRSRTVGFEQLAESITKKYLDTLIGPATGDSKASVNGHIDDSASIHNDHEYFHCPCGQCDLLSYLDNGCPKSNFKQYPYLDLSELDEDDKQDIVQRLSQDTSSIIQSFADLDSNTSESLRKQDISIDRLVNIALSIGVYMSDVSDASTLEDDKKELQGAKSIDAVFIILRNHWSFFDYGILSHIIKHLGSDADKENLKGYNEKFKLFCERKVTEVSPSIFDQDGQKRKRRKYFVVLITKAIVQNLKDVKAAERKVASLLGLAVSTLRLHRIDISSIILVFSIPSFLSSPRSFVYEASDFTLCAPEYQEKHVHFSTNDLRIEDHNLKFDDDPHVKRISIDLEYSVSRSPVGNSAISSTVADDLDIVLEKSVMNLDLGDDQESSDSEMEWEEEIEPSSHVNGGGRVTAPVPERSEGSSLTRERVECLYPPQVPSEEHIYDMPIVDQLSQISESCMSTSLAFSSMVPITLAAVVADDRLFLMFHRFLKDQCITRNLNFWLVCEHYRQLSTDNHEHLLAVAKAIYTKFIKNSAPQKVTIHADTKNRIKMSLDYKSEPLTVQLFDTAQQEIWKVMERNEVLQFAVSESFADCSQFAGFSLPSMSYMANPVYDVRGAGSLQYSGSEDSASLSSFSTDSDAGPQSTVMAQLSQPYQLPRKAFSDIGGSQPNRRNQSQQQQTHKLYAAKDNPLSLEMFVALVTERLLAVEKDRKAMEQRVRDNARQMGRSFNDIMSMEWYDHPESFKYLLNTSTSADQGVEDGVQAPSSTPSMALQEMADSNLHQSHSVKHILSPHSPGATPKSSQDHSSKKMLTHINSLAQQEVEHALKDLEFMNQMHVIQRRPRYSPTRTTSSVHSQTTSLDSGLGSSEGGSTGGLVTPIHNYTHAYIKGQTNQLLPIRQKEAQAAAIALISNLPQPDLLHPPDWRVTHHHRHGESQKRSQLSDNSSSYCTMTSQSSASEALFVPRRKHTQSVFTELDEPYHHQSRFRGTRKSSQPKHSYKQQQQHHQHQHPQSTPSNSPISHSLHRQQQQQLSQSSRGGGGSRSTSGGDILIVYHLDDFPIPFAKRLGGGEITLSDFKEKVFLRKGEYRFFFKRYCEDIQMEIMEEYSDEEAVLPLVQGKIIGRVEKISETQQGI